MHLRSVGTTGHFEPMQSWLNKCNRVTSNLEWSVQRILMVDDRRILKPFNPVYGFVSSTSYVH